MLKASILIPTKNGGDIFKDAITGIRKATQGIAAEIIVVDSTSTDGTDETARNIADTFIQIKPQDFGHGKTRNYLGSLAKGEFLVFVTQDAVPADQEWLKNLLKPFQDDQVAGVYSRQVPRYDNLLENYFLGQTYSTTPYVTAPSEGKRLLLKEVFFSNVSSAVRKKVFDQYPFSETQIVSEDQEWAKRVLRAGYYVAYEPSSVVIHSHNYNIRKLFHRNFDVGVSLIGLNEDRRHSMVYDGLAYLWKEFCYLLGKREWRWIWYFPFYEGCRFLGFLLGRKHKYLPKVLVRKFSMHRYYWK